jgi:hypothetical protein
MQRVRLSTLLRAVGEQLDILQVDSFNIFWAPDSITVEYQTRDGMREGRKFGIEKLRKLSLRMRLGRSNPDGESTSEAERTSPHPTRPGSILQGV